MHSHTTKLESWIPWQPAKVLLWRIPLWLACSLPARIVPWRLNFKTRLRQLKIAMDWQMWLVYRVRNKPPCTPTSPVPPNKSA